MSERRVRVRFAPSPTGPLHMGGVRTALYNYLFAKKHGGDFLLRIEDTDQTRFVPGAEEYIIESLKWCGIMPNEGQSIGGQYGPYRQSDRKEAQIYTQYALQLVESGNAYYAFDTSEELEQMREIAQKAKMPNWQYNCITRSSMKNSLSLSEDEVKAKLDANEPYTIRIKMPRNEDVRFHDEIRGWVTVNTNNLDDKVLYKSDGMPTYHLANIVDDYLMKITHVIRGEEWLPSAPLHVLLYRYLGWEEVMPKFAHLPLLLKPDGNGKLSKRDGDRLGFPVFPLEWHDPVTGEMSSGYREKGYFPDAFINMLAFLGWNPGTAQELFDLEQLTEAFTLERVSKSGAKFDPEKTRWFQQQYLKMRSDNELGEALSTLLEGKYSVDYCTKVAHLMKERSVFVVDMLEGMYFFEKPTEFDTETVSKKWNEKAPVIVEDLIQVFSNSTSWTADILENDFKSYLTEKSLGMGAVLPLFRLTVTGKGMGPSMFAIAELLGKEETLLRMKEGLLTINLSSR
jgi:glutamyl-tRNA synthetase